MLNKRTIYNISFLLFIIGVFLLLFSVPISNTANNNSLKLQTQNNKKNLVQQGVQYSSFSLNENSNIDLSENLIGGLLNKNDSLEKEKIDILKKSNIKPQTPTAGFAFIQNSINTESSVLNSLSRSFHNSLIKNLKNNKTITYTNFNVISSENFECGIFLDSCYYIKTIAAVLDTNKKLVLINSNNASIGDIYTNVKKNIKQGDYVIISGSLTDTEKFNTKNANLLVISPSNSRKKTKSYFITKNVWGFCEKIQNDYEKSANLTRFVFALKPIKNNLGKIPFMVDNVIVANKKYNLPTDFAPGESRVAHDALYNLIEAANKSNDKYASNLGYSYSGYRSYVEQVEVFNEYLITHGVNANEFAAKPGFSEHQTGLAFDIRFTDGSLYRGDTVNNPNSDYNIKNDWIYNNAYKFGFCVRYTNQTQSTTGYIGEPWHLRFFGNEMAEKLYISGVPVEKYFNLQYY